MALNLVYTTKWLEYKQLESFKEYDITPQQYNVLRILRGQQGNPIKVSDITERMLDKSSNTSRLVDKLLAKNLAKRTSCESDRRAVDVVITEEGLALLKVLDPFIEDWENRFNIISEEEAEQISALLDKLRENENQA
ncbi:DNA-binding MarR family transcriptional regulator [Dyadobacter sp. BE34]|uniref:DNA-binding MarR family transcriptional regulator n=1 Tax=Dyadobacter fermentans TaxID=94254 RepID=A0ABU1R250_9BACT|nr:DNA-binding MarR family transcriptional regulator [Dyadobacter fermentans]MDR7045169.1 DNA-binding MarR family transcriptional regulator [Dyadobacter sp. BE242]MDR7199094.1 DNA-binding MarR family transcriptional regulator [Dyadobacter sp. BE34]MDR7217054.1 DNA-binding MarR family transcriptional regulator [Dyadobacter sp. BE31]MDR7264987.1 DNA-binding MarR family transcriptional regulator [Dyadobacter sp. BE32]